MKKLIRLLIALITINLLPVSAVKAQEIEIIPMAGYAVTEKMDFTGGGWGRIDNGFTFGVTVTKKIKPFTFVEFLYSREDTYGSYDAYDYSTGVRISGQDIPLSVNYFQAGYGWLLALGASGKTEGFAAVDLGTALFSLKDDNESKWLFAAGFKIGLRRSVSEKIGILIQSAYQAPVHTAGNSVYSGTGDTEPGVPTLATINQFNFSAGLIIKL